MYSNKNMCINISCSYKECDTKKNYICLNNCIDFTYMDNEWICRKHIDEKLLTKNIFIKK